MSLINDLLRDLESRNAPAGAATALAGLRPVSRLTVAPGPRWVLPLAAMLVATSAFAVFRIDAGRTPTPLALEVPVAVATAADQTLPGAGSQRPLATLDEFSLSLGQRPRREEPTAPAPRRPATTAPKLELSISTLRPRRDAADARPAVVAPAAVRVPKPTTAAASLRRAGIAALADGRSSDAETHLRTLVERQPRRAEGWLHLARALTAQGNDVDAETVLIDALVAAADTAPIARELARRMLARQATEEALALLEAYRPRQALDVDHDAFIAAVLQRLGRHEGAAQRYRTVLAVRPETSAWWVGLAISEEARGKSEAALQAYRRARNIGNLDARLATYADQRITAMLRSDAS